MKLEEFDAKKNGTSLVEIKLHDLRRLFSSLHPAPSLEKDLDEGAEQCIVEAFREIGTAAEIPQEGLLISGWIARWLPIQILLYDWWPIQESKNIYRQIPSAPIQIRALPLEGHPEPVTR
jgi:hypothetical protein